MPRVDFYILPGRQTGSRLVLACRLAEKAYGLGHTVYIHTASPEQAQQLDELLWTFRQGSFVPHGLYPDADQDIPPVLIGWEPEPLVNATLLINLSDEAPAFLERFERVAELVDQDEKTLNLSRDKFRHYRAQGYELHSHKLTTGT